jgi:hypothetical protein
MGNVVGSLLGTSRLTRRADQFEGTARGYAEEAKFRPYTVTTGAGTTGFRDGEFFARLSQPYQDIQATTLGGALGLFEQAAAFDPAQRAQQVFGEQSALLQPAFQQQAQQLQQSLFGSGRLGLRLAGESAGLGAGSGMVQPDALGLGRAQQQTLAQIAAGAREQALGEQAQLANLASGLFGTGLNVSNLGMSLLGQGIGAEGARSAAGAQAGAVGTAFFDPVAAAYGQRAKAQTGFVGGLLGSVPMLGGFKPGG